MPTCSLLRENTRLVIPFGIREGMNVKTIERDIVIAEDGTLPPDFREAIDRKPRSIVYS